MSVIESKLVKVGLIITGNLWLHIDSTHTARSSILGRFNYTIKYERRVYGYSPNRTQGYYAQFRALSESNQLLNDNNYDLQQAGDYQIFINSLIAE